MRSGNRKLESTKDVSIASIATRFGMFILGIIIPLGLQSGCQRFGRISSDEIGDRFTIEDIPRRPLDRKATSRLSDSKSGKPAANRIARNDLKKPVQSARISDDVAPKAESIVATDSPEADLGKDLRSLPPDFKKLLENYLAESGKSKPVTASLADTDDASKTKPTTTADGVTVPDRIAVSDAKSTTRSMKDQNNVSEESFVVTASAIQPIEPAKRAENQDAEPQVVGTAPAQAGQGLAQPGSMKWDEHLEKAIEVLRSELQSSSTMPQDERIAIELKIRTLQVAAGRVHDAMSPITGLSPQENDFVRHQLQAMHDSANPHGIPVRRRLWSTVMESQRQATDRLAALSDLEIRSAAFCTSVDGYGVIKKFANYQFKQDEALLLYCELENIEAEQIKDQFETQLQGRYEIVDQTGQRVADQLLPVEKELCTNHRRDYFIVYRIYTPMQISPGSYQLRLTIEDMKAKKFGQAMLDFQIIK